ncbi:MAG: hypothetical protein P4L77_12125 [Sulfuriferula sp.]|nr:hypothetical protein [Sulfuriferula sp.]
MSYYYDNQTRSQAESLMEQQHYPVLEEDASEDDNYNDTFCACGHIREDHIEYVDECYMCDCEQFKESE